MVNHMKAIFVIANVKFWPSSSEDELVARAPNHPHLVCGLTLKVHFQLLQAKSNRKERPIKTYEKNGARGNSMR